MTDIRVNGYQLLAKLSGQSEDEVKRRFEAIREQHCKTKACGLHEMVCINPAAETFKKYRCRNCGWTPQPGELSAYEQGLKHGRGRPEGGGR